MKKIAVYGKGGIGKSTVSANLSAALAQRGRRVLQIGCDPKHDSTRLLTHGLKLTTVLDYLRVTNPLQYEVKDILVEGYGGIGCVEAGGPRPGVGCAGRGIISTFELLSQFRLDEHYDITIYDVLGDVVCGGFAVPIRREYADTIFLVTSGEFMALYAANNILRGIRNFDGSEKRVAGIIFNKRNIEGEEERVARFAVATELPLCAVIPRSDAFTRAEAVNQTVIEQGTDRELTAIFDRLAAIISDEEGKRLNRYAAKPLSDEDLEAKVLQTAAVNTVMLPEKPQAPQPTKTAPQSDQIDLTDPNRFLSKNLIKSEPLHGCAFNGAIMIGVHLKDAIVLAHGPKSCGYISYQTISSTGRHDLFERGALLPASISPNLEATEMGETEMIFGGMDQLEEKVRELKERKPKAIIVVSACPAGIIGDDIDKVKLLAEPDLPIVTVTANGNMAGDNQQGVIMTYIALARQIIKKDVLKQADTVNIVFEKVVAKNTPSNFKTIEAFLTRLKIKVNCRFLCETTFDKLQNFCAAPLNLLAYQDYTGQLLRDFFQREYGSEFLDMALPVGYDETVLWLRKVAAFFGRVETAETVITEYRARYDREIAALRPILEGKRLMIITFNHELDWILQTAVAVGIEIVKIGLLNSSQDEGFRTNLNLNLNIDEDYNGVDREKDLQTYAPDILLTNYASSGTEQVAVADTIPLCPDVGFFSGLILAKRWAQLLRLNVKGAWIEDERLYAKYYA